MAQRYRYNTEALIGVLHIVCKWWDVLAMLEGAAAVAGSWAGGTPCWCSWGCAARVLLLELLLLSAWTMLLLTYSCNPLTSAAVSTVVKSCRSRWGNWLGSCARLSSSIQVARSATLQNSDKLFTAASRWSTFSPGLPPRVLLILVKLSKGT